MNTRKIRYTAPDGMTLPGGIILREREEEPCFVVHEFSRERGQLEPVSFHGGGYHTFLAAAEHDFFQRVDRHRRYDKGGALLPVMDEADMLRFIAAEKPAPEPSAPYYSAEIKKPKDRREGLANFVQMIVNRIEAGDHREALLTAADLLEDLRCVSAPYGYIIDNMGGDPERAATVRLEATAVLEAADTSVARFHSAAGEAARLAEAEDDDDARTEYMHAEAEAYLNAIHAAEACGVIGPQTLAERLQLAVEIGRRRGA